MESIPHITELAKKFDKTRFIGVSILEDNNDKKVQDFVAKMGSKMEYSVAYSGNKTGMAKTWMNAVGIPVCLAASIQVFAIPVLFPL